MESNLYRACPVGSALTIEALYTFSCRRFPDGYTFKGWTYDKEGKQAFDPKKNADQDTTLYAQWEKNADSAPTNSTIPRTGDNQMALLASLCFSAAALIAVGIALTAYRKRKHA